MSSEVAAPELFYKLYGFILRVNLRLPGLTPYPSGSGQCGELRAPTLDPEITCQSTIRVELHESSANIAPRFSETAIYVSEYIGDFGIPILKIYDLGDGHPFQLCYDDGTEFLVTHDGCEIRGTWPPSMTFEDTVTYLVGPVMGFVLHLRGKLCLHASVVALQNHAIVLLGAAGAGKSTIAASFSRLGFPVLSDDVAVLDQKDTKQGDLGHEYVVQPGYQRICLTQEAAQSFYGARDALPTITPNWEKRALDLGHADAPFETRPLPLGAIYLLGERLATRSTIEIEPLSPRESLPELLAHTYVQYFLTPHQRGAEFPATARLAARVPVRRIHRPDGSGHMADTCHRLADDFADILASKSVDR